MHVLVIEPVATGHHMALYLRLVVRAAAELGWKVSVLSTASAVADPAFQLVRSDVPDIDVYLMPELRRAASYGSLTLLWSQYRCFRQVGRATAEIRRRCHVDLAYILDVGYFDKIAAVAGSPFSDLPWCGIMVSAKFHRHRLGLGPRSRSDSVYEYLFGRLLKIKKLRVLATIDEVFLAFAHDVGLSLSSKLAYIPDVGQLKGMESKNQARRRLGIDVDAFVVLVYGSLSRRKGIDELLTALSAMDVPSSIVAHLAGRQDESVAKILRTPRAEKLMREGRLVLSDHFHDMAMEYGAFVSADVVWLGYVGGAFGSSGVLYQACSMGLPIVATHEGLIGRIVRTHGVGRLVDPRDSAEVAACLVELASGEAFVQGHSENADRLAKEHTERKFMDAVVGTLVAGVETLGAA